MDRTPGLHDVGDAETITIRISKDLKKNVLLAAVLDERTLTSYVCKALRTAMLLDGIEREVLSEVAKKIKVEFKERLMLRVRKDGEE